MFEQNALPTLKQAIGIDQELLQRQQINGSNQAVRGWNAADMNEDANTLMWKANRAENAGDLENAAVLEQQGRDLMRRGQQWAPTVQNLTDVNSVESLGDWAGGALGNVRSSIRPALGGLAGAAVGAVAAPFTAGVINPLVGARVGAGLAGYDTMTESNVAEMMMDERIRANRTAAEIGNTARGAGAVQGALEAVVPAGVAGSVVGLGGRKAAAEIAKNGLLKTAGKRVGIDAAKEFATEFAQNPVGDVAKNYLAGDDLDNIDWKAALNAGAAGAVAGGGMGAVGAVGDVVHAGIGQGVDKVAEIKNEPLGTALDVGVDLAAKAGTLKAKAENWLDEREMKKNGMSDDDIAQAHLANVQSIIAGKSDLQSTSPFTEEENAMDAPTFNAHHENKLKADAATILKAGRDSTAEEKSLAVDFGSGKIDAVEFQTRLHEAQANKKVEKQTDSLLSALGQNSKKSMMRPSDRMYLESELLKPDTSTQKVHTLADILRKQGTDEKLIEASKGDAQQREMVGLMNWISEGMNGVTEAAPAIAKRYGKSAPALFNKAYNLAKRNGLIKANDEVAADVSEQLAQAANTEGRIHAALKAGLSDIALKDVTDVDAAVKRLVPMMKTVVQEGMSPKTKQALIDNVFGTEESLHTVMNAFIDSDEHKKQVSKATGGGKEEVAIDENGDPIVEAYGSGTSETESKGPKIVGFTNPKKGAPQPFNLGYNPEVRAKLDEIKGKHESEPGTHVKEVGVWEATVRDLGRDEVAKQSAMIDLLQLYGPKLKDEGKYASLIKNFSEGGIDVADLTKPQRYALTGRINQQFRYLEVQHAEGGDTKHNIEDVASFKYTKFDSDKKPVNQKTFTAQQGVIFLERKLPGKEPSHFPVNTTQLVKQAFATEKEGTDGSTLDNGKGALGTYHLVMSGLTDLLSSEPTFSTRIGFRLEPGAELTWIEHTKTAAKGNKSLALFPKELALGNTGVTVADAQAQADVERRAEKPGAASIGYAENHKERVKALIEVANRESTSPKFKAVINRTIGKGAPSVVQLYRQMRDQWQGDPEGFGGTPRSVKVEAGHPVEDTERTTEMRRKSQTQDDSDIPSGDIAARGRIEAEDGGAKEVHRDSEGKRVGLSTDAEGAGYEGRSTTGVAPVESRKKGDKPYSTLTAEQKAENEKLTDAGKDPKHFPKGLGSERIAEGVKADPFVLPNTHEVSVAKKESAQPKALDKLENVKDRIVAALGQGVPFLMSRRATLTQENREIFDIAIVGVTNLKKIAEVVASTKKEDNGVVKKVTNHVGERYGEDVQIGLADLSTDKLAALYKLDAAAAKELKVKLVNAAKLISGKISSLEEANANDARGSGQSAAVGKPKGNSGNPANDSTGNSPIPVVGQTQGAGNTGSSETGVASQPGIKVTLPKTSPHTQKDQAKSDKANKFIGRGSPRSSTAGYAKAWGAKANTGEYVSTDRVFVSAEGARSERESVDMAELQMALDAGATILTDDAANRNRPYNVGEREVNDALVSNGYTETSPGIWEAPTTKPSAQQPKNQAKGNLHEQVAKAKEHILKTVGMVPLFQRMTGSSGSWTEGQTVNTIKLALNGDVLGAAFHESFHEFFDILKKNGGEKTIAVLQRAAMSPLMQTKLRRLLTKHPEAQAQLAQPEEAAAFMYQFWSAGALKVGPETRTAFQWIKDQLKKVAGVFSESFRKEVQAMSKEDMLNGHAELLMRSFSEGAVADTTTRSAVVAALNANTDAHEAAVKKVGSAFQTLTNTAGKLVFSAEAMMDATGNKHMVNLVRGFHQKIGTPMRQVGNSTGGYSDGLRQTTSRFVNKVEDVLMAYDKEDLELAREAMSTETTPTDPVVKEIVAKVQAHYADLAKYMQTKGVKRLNTERVDPETGLRGVWEDIPVRKNYFSQVWSVDAVMADFDGFKADLLKHHMKELTSIAEQANEELKTMKGIKPGTAAAAELARADKEFADSGKIMAKSNIQTITPEMIADAIGSRLLESQGHIEIDEDTSSMGITPAASAVNKRQLDWLDKTVFDKYKEKDLTRILATYTRSVVKRGEFQSRFGPGGEVIGNAADKAVLYELGGDSLVNAAVAELPAAKKQWASAKSEALKAGEEFTEPFPTLRSVGQNTHRADVGAEKHTAALNTAMKKLENSFRAIQALEGTLGRDITANKRALNSWMVTYQSFRTLSTMLFTSFQDVMGLVANGGDMGDAWNAFVSGLREIKSTWTDKKTPGEMMERAEFWGVVDAGSFLDTTSGMHGSPFMSGKAKEWTDKFFKWTGAEGWNRGVRAVAAQVAERIITDWKKNGIDLKDNAAVARVEDLFGKGFEVADIKLDAEGRLDINDVANQAAVTRWMLTAVPAPTAAHRPIWGSDPHFQVFMHLKNYTYSFHRIMMKGAIEQARLGNLRPAAAMALGYMPIAIAAGAIKEMLIPGEEPPWMQGGLDGYLSYGWSRAGVLGVPQMYGSTVYDMDPAALFGPSVDQLQNVLSVPFGEFAAMRDHTMLGEGLGALPGGNVLKRMAG